MEGLIFGILRYQTLSCENDNHSFFKTPLCLALSNFYRLNKLQACR